MGLWPRQVPGSASPQQRGAQQAVAAALAVRTAAALRPALALRALVLIVHLSGTLQGCRKQGCCKERLKEHAKQDGVVHSSLTGFSFGASCSTSGAIHPSVPGMPERRLKLCRPPWSFLHRPKSEMTARICPWLFGTEMRMLQGFRSR